MAIAACRTSPLIGAVVDRFVSSPKLVTSVGICVLVWLILNIASPNAMTLQQRLLTAVM